MVLVWGNLAFNNGALWALRKMGHLYIKKKKLYLENKKTKDMFEKCFLEYFFLFYKIKI